MSGVVLRCSACGTTQSHLGECDACSEGEVRYFCSNHTPGRWLDEPSCGSCGAQFGDPIAEPPPAPAWVPPASARPPARRERPLPTPRVSSSPRIEPWSAPEAESPEEAPATPSLADVLVEMLEEGERGRSRREPPPPPPWEPTVDVALKPSRFLGCLFKLVLLIVLMLLLGLGALFS